MQWQSLPSAAFEDVDRPLGNIRNFLHGLTKPCVQKCRNANPYTVRQEENEEVWGIKTIHFTTAITNNHSVNQVEMIYRAVPPNPAQPIS